MTTMDYAKARALMVEQQVRPWDVLDPRILDVLSALPREAFIAETHRKLAYADLALPLPHGEAMMKPVLEGRTLQSLGLEPGDTVLEIGAGSGFLSACLGRLAREVVSLERHGDMADTARARLAEQGIGNVRVEHADAFAWRTERRFSAVCVTGAVAEIPAQFMQWLQPGGRMFIVRGRSPAMEGLIVHAADGNDCNDVNAARIQSLFETDLPYLAGAAPAPTFEF
jgi:protein-L-isoaspartate(D-aspartate) O-methyltransferase